jgi:hypothetical protein
MISALITRLVALWDDSWFFQVNVVLLITGVVFLWFVW